MILDEFKLSTKVGIIAQAVDTFGKIDILVNNAGIICRQKRGHGYYPGVGEHRKIYKG
ncbi:MAG: hypothetical protein GXY86_02445 [Firmicutes bacterium]|nr:hypothetical protein [Bacillota bacterium]